MVSICSLTSVAQDSASPNILNGINIRIGIEMSAVNNYRGYSNISDNINFFGSVSLSFGSRTQIDFMYRYMNDLSRSQGGFREGDQYWSHVIELYQNYNSHLLSVKANYFISGKKVWARFYLTGGISAALQQVHNEYAESLGVNYTVTDLRKYTRFLSGPEFGAGMFLELGKINFQSEFTFSAGFSTFVDTGYRELSFNLLNGLVYEF